MTGVVRPTSDSQRVYDSAGKPDPKAVKANGGVAVICYLSKPSLAYRLLGKRYPKDWTPAYRDDVAAEGLGIGVSVEQSAGTLLTGYSKENVDLMKWAQDGAEDLGFPRQLPLLMNNDTDAYKAEHVVAGNRAFDAYDDHNRRNHPLGLYGGMWILNRLRNRYEYAWCSNATSWNHGEPWSKENVHMKQGFHLTLPGTNTSVDPNLSFRMPFWFPSETPATPTPNPIPPPAPTPPAPPPNSGDLVIYIIQCSDAAASFKGLGWHSPAAGGPIIPQVAWIRTAEELAQHKAFGCPVLLRRWSELTGVDCTRPLPPPGVDPGHEWTGAEFRTVVG